MMFYTTIDDKEVKFTGKRGIAEWSNEDCPDIFAYIGYEWASKVFECSINGFWFNDELDAETVALLVNFIEKSDKLFYKKYPQMGEYTGRIAKRAIRAGTQPGVVTA